jgi:RNA polymerase sigma-70 factor (ECF subfamily)
MVDRAPSDACDAALLESWAAGNQLAGAELIERHTKLLQRFFRNKADHVHVEDLVQQTLLASLEGRERYRREARFETFLLAIARFQLYSHYRRARRAAAIDFSLDSVRDLGTSPSEAIAKRADHRALFDALQTLPLEQQIVLELVYWEELSGAELAEVLGISTNGAYTRLHRAKLALRAALHRRIPSIIGDEHTLEQLDTWAREVQVHCLR